jgi:hypothetical protein
MRVKTKLFFTIVTMALVCISTGFSNKLKDEKTEIVRGIMTSDTILSGMITSLPPPNRYSIEAIFPPGQCPGHYGDVLAQAGVKNPGLGIEVKR